MRFEIVTIFPAFFTGFFENGIVRRALAEELVTVGVHDLRAFTHDRHRTVDDRPFGGGEGMVLKAEPLAEALASLGIAPRAQQTATEDTDFSAEGADLSKKSAGLSVKDTGLSVKDTGLSVKGTGLSPYIEPTEKSGALAPEGNRPTVILLSAQGQRFTQATARALSKLDRVVLICGRYEGIDERINQLYCDMELSIGDYVLSGGELAAAVVVDATMRLIPGVLGNEASSEFESFGIADADIDTDIDGVPRSQHGAGGLLDYPHYTRPAEFAGLRAPDVLMNGDHLEIRRWRRQQQLRKTLANRPDLIEAAALTPEDRRLLDTIMREQRERLTEESR